jgi:hypothetical protein
MLVFNASAINVSVHTLTANVTANVTTASVVEAWPSPILVNSVLLLAVVAGSFLYISPIRSVMQAQREQMSLKELASWLLPTYCMFAQSYLWSCYGFYAGSLGIARFNGLGAGVCLLYIGLVAKCIQPRETLQPLILLAIIAIVVFSIGVVAFAQDASHVFAYTATFFNLGMVFAPLREAACVVQTGSHEQFPMAITIACFLQSLFWAQYSVLIHDHFYFIPNFIGTVVCGAELMIVYWFVGLSGGYAAKSNRGLEGLQAGEDRPLMPRTRGKTGASNCSNLMSFLSGGSRKQRACSEFGLPDFFQCSQKRPNTAQRLETWSQAKAHEMPNPELSRKSPFSEWSQADNMGSIDSTENFDEPELEPQNMNENPTQDTFLNGGFYRSFEGSRSGLDCIL